MPDDLSFETLDVHATDEASLKRLAAYADCWSQAFFEGRLSERSRELWLEASRADDVLLRAVYAPSTWRPAHAPVATFSSWRGQLNVGAGRTVGLHMISDVTVEASHRRRGLLRRTMTDDLAAAVERRLPMAALTVSEGTIYGRFGFGPATRVREVQVDTTSRFALHRAAASTTGDLRVEVLDPEPAYEAVRAVDADVLATARGAISRPAFYAAGDVGRIDWSTGEPDRTTRVAVVLDADGRPTGYARFRPADLEGRPGAEARVLRLHAVDDASYLRLWALLGSLDLVQHVTARVRVEDPLDLAVSDPRVVRTDRLRDQVWLRVLDPVAALEARPWREDGSVVVEVEDGLGHAGGRFRVTVRDTRAQVEHTADPAEVALGVETLSSLYLGDRTAAELAAVGRISGPGTGPFAAMADHAGPPPWNTTDF